MKIQTNLINYLILRKNLDDFFLSSLYFDLDSVHIPIIQLVRNLLFNFKETLLIKLFRIKLKSDDSFFVCNLVSTTK